MNEARRKRIEAAGFKVGTVAEFLGLSEREERLVELRVALAKAIRSRREAAGLTHRQLAEQMGISPSRVVKLEAASGASLDALFRHLFALGGRLSDVTGRNGRRKRAGVRG